MAHIKLNGQTYKEILQKLRALDKRVLIQNGIIAAAVLIFIFLFFIPILAQNQKTIKEVNYLTLMLQGAKAKIALIPKMRKEKEELTARANEVREQFFKTEEIDQLISIISTVLVNANIKITASRPGAPSKTLPTPFDKFYTAATYELALEGSYHDLGKAINELERYPKNFTIDGLTILGSDKGGSENKENLILTAFIKTPEK